MFTGIIEEIGQVKGIKNISNGKRINIQAKTVIEDTKIGDSIAINGTCLTVVQLENDSFWAEAVGETLKKTTIGLLKFGTSVNLERALQMQSRLGGHIVQGHVNAACKVFKITKLGDNYLLEFKIETSLRKYVIEEGSITVDGISLTIASIENDKIKISVIPHTWQHTTLQFLKTGDIINIETDVLAKYIENMVKFSNSRSDSDIFTDKWFNKMGY